MKRKSLHIGFDADDTLWHCEDLFLEAQEKLQSLLPDRSLQEITDAVYQVEKQNLEIYGYGVKSFTLSLIEAYLALSQNVKTNEIGQLLEIGKSILESPIRIMDDVENTLKNLSKIYTLLIITKGELIDQRRKIRLSKLSQYFDIIEIVAEKSADTYSQILERHKITPQNFTMIGNSIRSDIQPVLEIGGRAIHIPYKHTWKHEEECAGWSVEPHVTLKSIRSVPEWLLKTSFNINQF